MICINNQTTTDLLFDYLVINQSISCRNSSFKMGLTSALVGGGMGVGIQMFSNYAAKIPISRSESVRPACMHAPSNIMTLTLHFCFCLLFQNLGCTWASFLLDATLVTNTPSGKRRLPKMSTGFVWPTECLPWWAVTLGFATKLRRKNK